MAGASDRGPNCRLKQLLQVTRRGENQEKTSGDLRALVLTPAYGLQYQMMPTQDLEPEDIPYPLTREEAFSFLENVLEMTDPEGLLKSDRLGFLNTFIENMITKIPFTNLGQVSQPMNNKHNPTLEECKSSIFLRQGGHCLYKNMFSKALFDLMGYETFHVGGNNVGEEQFDTHCGIIVCDLSYPGSMHLAEPGTRRPLFRAIPLDFEEESPVYKFHFMRSKFFRRDHGIILWCAHAPRETAPSTHIIESEGAFWKVQLLYRLHVKRSRAFYLEKGNYRFGLPGLMPQIHQNAFVVAYKEGRIFSIAYESHRGLLRDTGGMKIDCEDPSETKVQLLTEKEVVDTIVLHFPQFPRPLVQSAVDNVHYGGHLYRI